MPSILQCHPQSSYLSHRTAIDAAIARVLVGESYILGSETSAFENEFAAYLGLSHSIGVANGTDAIELALRALDIGPGDGVLTVSHTAVATVAAITLTGATPVLVDVDPESCTLCPKALEKILSEWNHGTLSGKPKLKAIVPVHLYGRPAAMEDILSLAEKHGLAVVEDCAQAHGATWRGRRVGTFGIASAFSFYPTKNLGAIGDGGAVATSDGALADRVRHLRQYGWNRERIAVLPGKNSRLDELQAAILRAKLPHLNADNDKRRALSEIYRQALLGKIGLVEGDGPDFLSARHQFVIRHPKRDTLRERLRGNGILTLVHYPHPAHLHPGYQNLCVIPLPLLETERAAAEVLSLPLFPELPPQDAETVCTALLEILPSA